MTKKELHREFLDKLDFEGGGVEYFFLHYLYPEDAGKYYKLPVSLVIAAGKFCDAAKELDMELEKLREECDYDQ